MEVAQRVAEGVADLPVALGQAPEDGLREPDVVAVVGGGDPEPDDLRAVLLDELLRLDRVADGLGHLPSLAVHDEPVR